ncbi:MAG: DUF5360 family protein [Bacteroidota bacterium]|jgi:hypothetical protein|nr:YvaD family protein [Cytophagales bacterium]MCE2956925.1 YvaD family protein [Flammeovirgaceae bacterium]MCZ8072229.1 DUF5360 family protein [Cytophagales bacterium]
MKTLKYFFLLVDIGFIGYWVITALHLIPAQYLYNDYTNSILVNWNWSFFPLDILISATGLFSIYLHSKQKKEWKAIALVSLVLTSVSGLQAVSYWTLSGEMDLNWWLPNLFLLIYPLFYIPNFVKEVPAADSGRA